MKKRVISILMVGALAMGLVTGCGSRGNTQDSQGSSKGSSGEKVTLSVLAGQSTTDAGIEEFIDAALEKKYPEIKLEWECVDWGNDFQPKMQQYMQSGLPDIMIGKAQDVQIYAGTGNLAKISDSYLGKIKKDALKEVTVDGAVYGIPYNAWYQGVIYNKDIFQKYKLTPPTTREGLEEVVACLERKGIVPFASHFQESWEVANMTMQYMMNEIFDKMPDWGDQFRKGTKNYEGNAEVQNCFKNNQFILNHTWEDAFQIDQFECDNRFVRGEAAMYLTGSWSMQFSSQYGKDIDFGIFPFPNQAGDAKLIKETNMTFMKSAKTEQEDLIDQIFNRLLSDRKLAQEIADFTQTSSLIEGVTDNSQNKIQSDIQSYEEKNEVIDVTTGNEQLIWTFQKKVAEQQLLWLNKKISLEDALKYADDHREQSFE